MKKIHQKDCVINFQLYLMNAYHDAKECNNEQMIKSLEFLMVQFEEFFDINFKDIFKHQ